MSTLVSVLIPTHNAARHLAATLDSLCAQSEKNWEAIVVDDGSSDRTFDVASGYAQRDRRIQVVAQEHGGTQAARNAGLARARGEWVALLDHDDTWHPEKLATQLALARRDPRANLLFTNYTDWDGSRDLRLRYRRPVDVPAGDVAVDLARGCLFQASTVMVPRRLVEAIGGFDPRFHYCGDWALWLAIARRGIEARGTWRPLVRYRVWAGNESRHLCAMQAEVVCMLEHAGSVAPAGRLRRACALGLRHARVRREIINLAHEPAPMHLARRLWRCWHAEPWQVRYLARGLACALPIALGGLQVRAYVLARLRRKFRSARAITPFPPSLFPERR